MNVPKQKYPVEDFFHALFDEVLKDGKHFIERRQIWRDQSRTPISQFYSSVDALLQDCKKRQPVGADWYFGVHARNKNGGKKAEDVDIVTCLFVDIDSKTSDVLDLIKKHPHTIIVDSGHGYHGYSLLKTPLSLKDHGKEYAEASGDYRWALNADEKAKDNARLLRIPGSINYKYSDKPIICQIVEFNNQRYELSDFASLNSQPKANTKQNAQTPSGEAKIKQGERNNYLTRVAGQLRQKGLGEGAILAALLAENQEKCNPPLSESEVQIIAHSVAKYEPSNKGVAEILADAGFDKLTDKSSIDEVGTVLEVLRNNALRVDKLKRNLIRNEVVKRLKNIDIDSASRLVDAALSPPDQNGAESGGESKALLIEDPEPWNDPVDGAELLENLTAFFQKYVILPHNGAPVLALWTLYTYGYVAFDVAPYLILSSPEKRCGKTRVLELLDVTARRTFSFANLTLATAFRIVDTFHPTLLVDEADRFLAKGQNEELKGILNAGYRRGAVVARCVGDDHDVKTFDPYCPKAIASIGGVTETLEDRAVVFGMSRRADGEEICKFRQRDAKAESEPFRRQAARWAQDNIEALKSHDPVVPDGLNDRQEDNWRPLLAVAEVCGGRWPELARKYAVTFSVSANDESVTVILLSDIRDLFEAKNTTKLPSADIIDALKDMEEKPWPEWKNGKPITAAQLARLLKKYDIRPRQIWIGGNKHGYELEDFKDAFSRYLPHSNSAKAPKGPLDPLGLRPPNKV